MKKTYKPAPKNTTARGLQIGALVALVAGVALLAVAAFTFWRNNTTAPSPGFTPKRQAARA